MSTLKEHEAEQAAITERYQNELVDRVAPRWAWDTIDETLTCDRSSIAFDPALRDAIGKAIDAMIKACEEDMS